MKKALLILLAFLTVSSLSAKPEFLQNQLGASASMFSGAGLSYKYIFDDTWAAKTTVFLYYYDDKSYDESQLWGSIGGEVQYYLHHSKHTGLYLLVGLSEWYDENQNNYDSKQNAYTSKNIDRRFTIGPGFGLDLIVWDNIVLNFDFGFLYTLTNNDTNSIYDRNTDTESYTYGGGIGLSYRF